MAIHWDLRYSFLINRGPAAFRDWLFTSTSSDKTGLIVHCKSYLWLEGVCPPLGTGGSRHCYNWTESCQWLWGAEDTNAPQMVPAITQSTILSEPSENNWGQDAEPQASTGHKTTIERLAIVHNEYGVCVLYSCTIINTLMIFVRFKAWNGGQLPYNVCCSIWIHSNLTKIQNTEWSTL